MKLCTYCKIEKDEINYSFTEGAKKNSKCKKCVSLYNSYYRELNKKKKIQADRLYRLVNKERINSKRRVNNLTSKEIEEKRLKNKSYREVNSLNINFNRRRRKKERFLTDPSYRIRESFGSHFRQSLKIQKIDKKSSCFNILNYTFSDLKEHLQSLFEPWMNWNNFGTYSISTWDDNDQSTWTWQIDHIVPKANFVFSGSNCGEIKKCWALQNLRPYSAKQNNIDGGSKIRHKT